MPAKKRKVWVWLTWQQVDALLTVAQMIDAKPEALATGLPEAGDRFAFRGAITALRNVRGAMETSE